MPICSYPFNVISIGVNGDTFPCVCEGWVTKSTGNILDHSSFEEFYNSDVVLDFQQSVVNQSYRYCRLDICDLAGDFGNVPEVRHTPEKLVLAYDRSCNLQCPSCRSELINEASEQAYKVNDHVKSLLYKVKQDVLINITGSGDPFGSKLFRDLIYSWSASPLNKHIKLDLQTNGLLIKKCWPKVNPDIVSQVRISFDAATPNTYYKTRFPGDFFQLLESIDIISEERKKHKFNLVSDFVVQTVNYKEMADYVKLCLDYGFDDINFSVIQPWAQNTEVFLDKAVWYPSHPKYNDLLTELENPIFLNKHVHLPFQLSKYIN